MNLKFLADESCDFAVVRCLRTANYDVEAIMEIASGESDANIIKMADAIRDLIQKKGDSLVGCFVVASPLKVRIRTRV